jgi:hypothetical protein
MSYESLARIQRNIGLLRTFGLCLENLAYERSKNLQSLSVILRKLLKISYRILYREIKVKVTLLQVLRLCTGRTAQKGSRGIALLYRH